MRLNHYNPISSGGFTLIEMMVVLVIIAITAAVVIPEMKGTFADALLRSTGRDLANVVNMASSRAVNLNQVCRLNLNTHNGRYLIERQTHEGVRMEYVPVKDVPGGSGTLDSRITVEVATPTPISTEEESSAPPPLEAAVPDTISFYPDGTADAAEIRLRDRDGFQLVLQINPVTGRVHLTDTKHE